MKMTHCFKVAIQKGAPDLESITDFLNHYLDGHEKKIVYDYIMVALRKIIDDRHPVYRDRLARGLKEYFEHEAVGRRISAEDDPDEAEPLLEEADKLRDAARMLDECLGLEKYLPEAMGYGYEKGLLPIIAEYL